MTYNIDIGSMAMLAYEGQFRSNGEYSTYGEESTSLEEDLFHRMLRIHENMLSNPQRLFFKAARKLGLIGLCFKEELQHFRNQANLHSDAELFDTDFDAGLFALEDELRAKLIDLTDQFELGSSANAKTALAEFKAEIYRTYKAMT